MTPEPIAPPRPSLAPAPAPKKKEPKPALSFQREIEMITSAPVGQGPRRAMDYEPPASFLQNMDRPVREQRTMGQPAKNNVLSDLWSV